MTLWNPQRPATPGRRRLALWALCGAPPLLGLAGPWQIARPDPEPASEP